MTLSVPRAAAVLLACCLLAAGVAGAQEFTGRVVEDSTGDAVATAEIRIHKTGMRELAADLDTDRTGHFAGSELAPGDYTIDVVKPNYTTTSFPAHLPVHSIQIRLVHFAVMDGRVTNVQGEPAVGIVRAPYGQTIGATRVTVLAKGAEGEELRAIRNATLDEDGHFRFFDLPPGQYELGMWFYGINEGSGMQLYPDNANPRVFTVAGGEVYKDLDFLIAPNPEYKVSGAVQLPEPGMKFVLALGLPDQPALPAAIAIAADDGSFQFDKLPSGTYDLFAAGPANGYTQFESVLGGKGEIQFGRMRIQVAGSDIAGLAVPLSAAKSLAVILRGHGGAAYPAACPQTANVELTSLEPWGIQFRARSPVSAAKAQTISNLPPGRFRIAVNGLGPDCFEASPVVVDLSKEEAQTVAVEVAAAGSIHATIAAGGAPAAAYAAVLLDPANPNGASRLAFPDAEGHFVFDTLPPGAYRIAAEPATETSKNRWVTEVSGMKEIAVTGGGVTSVELAAPAPRGDSQ